ncbi:unnamed protein product [Polarella glacialis]|uniref:Uncharacterized protein n=1 Tax=Polarella glacialis TaxID=89957 RepID=A0A813FHH3_POLGL|nr:unnamed protein product [Polarella glacialis]
MLSAPDYVVSHVHSNCSTQPQASGSALPGHVSSSSRRKPQPFKQVFLHCPLPEAPATQRVASRSGPPPADTLSELLLGMIPRRGKSKRVSRSSSSLECLPVAAPRFTDTGHTAACSLHLFRFSFASTSRQNRACKVLV